MKPQKNEKAYTIGKAKDNAIVCDFEDVSDYHAVINIEGKEVVLEDLNSTNGTYVDGSRIKRTVLHPSCKIYAGKHQVNIAEIFGLLLADPAFNDYTEEFNQLKQVYDDYEMEKERILKESQRKISIQKFMIMSLPIIIFAAWFVQWEKLSRFYNAFYIALNSILSAVALFLTNDKSKDGKLKKAKIEFNKKYKCPRCKTYQLSKEWELHRDEKHCPNCKAIWAKEYVPDF
jgi:ssDNA-binding Zn-finger/Zn-ribbon topoisomerase 1